MALNNTVSLLDPALGTTQSDAPLTGLFTLTLTTPTIFRFAFTANPYLIAQMDRPHIFATADYSFSLIIRDGATNATVVNFTPDGVVGNAIGGTDFLARIA